MRKREFTAIRSVNWARVSLNSCTGWRTTPRGCISRILKRIPSGLFFSQYSMRTVAVRRWCVRFRPLGRPGTAHSLGVHLLSSPQQAGARLENILHIFAAAWPRAPRVVVVDGTGVSMPDTPANQEIPQLVNQKPGCGFPATRVCACFCLQTGRLAQLGNKKSHELPLLRHSGKPVTSFSATRGFAATSTSASSMQRDSVSTLARRSPVEASSAVNLLIQWPKPAWNKNLSYSKRSGWHYISSPCVRLK